MTAIGLVGLGGYVIGVRAAKRPAVATAVALPASTPKPILAETLPKPVRLEGKALVEAVRAYVKRSVVTLFHKAETVNDVKFLAIEVQESRPDRRKIPWLWESTVSFIVAQNVSESEQYSMKILSQFTPEMKGADCWRVMAHVKTGIEKYDHLEQSEWTVTFRDQVRYEWDETLQKWNDFRSERKMTEDYAYSKLGEMKARLAERLRLSDEEFQEIMNTPDDR